MTFGRRRMVFSAAALALTASITSATAAMACGKVPPTPNCGTTSVSAHGWFGQHAPAPKPCPPAPKPSPSPSGSPTVSPSPTASGGQYSN